MNTPFVVHLGGPIGDDECCLEVVVCHPTRADLSPHHICAVIDTGAQSSGISRDIALDLRLPKIGESVVTWANGHREVRDIVIAQITVPGFGGPMSFAWAVIAQQGMDGMLFGMDLLAGGVLIVDAVLRTWEIRYVHVGDVGSPGGRVPPTEEQFRAQWPE